MPFGMEVSDCHLPLVWLLNSLEYEMGATITNSLLPAISNMGIPTPRAAFTSDNTPYRMNALLAQTEFWHALSFRFANHRNSYENA